MRYAWQKDLGAVEGDLMPWLQLLDRVLDSNSPITGKPREMLQRVLKNAGESVGHPIKACDLLTSTAFRDRRSTSMPDTEDVVLTMFLWQ